MFPVCQVYEPNNNHQCNGYFHFTFNDFNIHHFHFINVVKSDTSHLAMIYKIPMLNRMLFVSPHSVFLPRLHVCNLFLLGAFAFCLHRSC